MRQLLLILILNTFTPLLPGLTLGVFVALNDDIQSLKEAGATEVRTVTVGSTPIQDLRFHNHRILVCKMGSGPVQTALNAQALLTVAQCDLVLSVGPVGNLSSDLTKKGDEWFRVTEVIPWQKGSIQGTLQTRGVAKSLGIPVPGVFSKEQLADFQPMKVVSGESFIASDEFRTTLRNRTKGESVDMNLFGLIEAIKAHRIESLHLRIISDNANKNASEEFKAFVKNYQGEGGKLIAKMISALPEDKTSPDTYPGLRKLIIPKPKEIDQPELKSTETD